MSSNGKGQQAVSCARGAKNEQDRFLQRLEGGFFSI